MITIKHKDYTFFATSINLHVNEEGVASLWANLIGSKSRKLVEGKYEDVLEYRKAIEFCIENGQKIFEF